MTFNPDQFMVDEASKDLAPFIGRQQLSVMRDMARGEEKEFFIVRMVELAAHVSTMPKVYEQDGKGDAAIIGLHYFTAGADWYITERDTSAEQHQAFGLADLFGNGGELGYISIAELIANGAELDIHWTPRSLGEIRAKRERRAA